MHRRETMSPFKSLGIAASNIEEALAFTRSQRPVHHCSVSVGSIVSFSRGEAVSHLAYTCSTAPITPCHQVALDYEMSDITELDTSNQSWKVSAVSVPSAISGMGVRDIVPGFTCS